jgi:hypothetical protein
MPNVNKKLSRGGARPGAGRKDPATKKRMNFTIDVELAARLKREANQSATVEAALRAYYKN